MYIEGSSQWITVASYVLFALCLAYKALGWIAWMVASKVNVKEDEYERLVIEAREKLSRKAKEEDEDSKDF